MGKGILKGRNWELQGAKVSYKVEKEELQEGDARGKWSCKGKEERVIEHSEIVL